MKCGRSRRDKPPGLNEVNFHTRKSMTRSSTNWMKVLNWGFSYLMPLAILR
jgi:hypothetical protein